MSRLLVTVLTALAILVTQAAADHTSSDPLKPQMEIAGVKGREALGQPALDSAELDLYIMNMMDSVHIPGLAACGISGGQIVWTGTFGYANLETSAEVTNTTLFGIASVTKPFTAAALMHVWENGLFNLDDAINDYLPFAVVNPHCPETDITFRMLLSFTGSINFGDYGDPGVFREGDPFISLSEFLERTLVPGGEYYNADSIFLSGCPGTEYQYSNETAALAGYLIEAITGMAYEQYCQDSLFGPLGMTETSHFFGDLDTEKLAMGYFRVDDGYEATGWYSTPLTPAGALKTSALQIARFHLMLMNGGEIDGTRVLESNTIDTIFTPSVPHLAPQMGMYWGITYNSLGIKSCSFGGGGFGVSCATQVFPENGTSVIVLTNGHYEDVGYGPTDIRFEILRFIHDFDDDGIRGGHDNCPIDYNPDQTDSDADGVGDVCDVCEGHDDNLDVDGDGMADGCDECTDTDGDGYGNPGFAANLCDQDNCPDSPNSDQIDSDSDGAGDACDDCPGDPGKVVPGQCGCGVADADSDGDGVADCNDICNGFDDLADADSDNIPDGCDECTDTDGDGYGNPGYATNTCEDDNCPDVLNPGQQDYDDNGVGDICQEWDGRNAVAMDGLGAHVRIPGSSDFAFGSGDFTIELWTMPVLSSGLYGCGVFFANQNFETLSLGHVAGGLESGLWFMGGGEPIWSDQLTWYTGQWYHIAVTRADNVLRIYRDGVDVSGELTLLGDVGNSLDLYFGIRVEDDCHLEGIIDEIRIWTIARTAEELSSYYRYAVNPGTPGLVGYWNFNEVTGDQTVLDISPHENHGTLGTNTSVETADAVRVSSSAPVIDTLDNDSDGIMNPLDLCPDDYDPNQDDRDFDLIGDVCDNCPDHYNPDQEDDDNDDIGDVCEAGYTPAGSHIEVMITDSLWVTFDEVTVPGETSVIISAEGPAAPLPAGYQIIPIGGDPVFYDIETTAEFSGQVKVCLAYDDTHVTRLEENLSLWHWQEEPPEPVCITSSVNTETNILCGVTTSLSVFALAERLTCCTGRVGDANDQSGDEPTISDISVLIDAKFISGTCDGKITCLAEADVNQSGGTDPACGDITISDISILIDYLFITGPETATLLECL